jgi:hypothetical protein
VRFSFEWFKKRVRFGNEDLFMIIQGVGGSRLFKIWKAVTGVREVVDTDE